MKQPNDGRPKLDIEVKVKIPIKVKSKSERVREALNNYRPSRWKRFWGVVTNMFKANQKFD